LFPCPRSFTAALFELSPPLDVVDTASREIDRPCGETVSFQISADSVEPTAASLSRNLLSHDDSGPSGTDEAMKVRPQMPWIIGSEPFAGGRERLAGARSGP
jgi:hypothetical protein